MRSLITKYRPVRQRTVRGETTKDKAGTLPIGLYVQSTSNVVSDPFSSPDTVPGVIPVSVPGDDDVSDVTVRVALADDDVMDDDASDVTVGVATSDEDAKTEEVEEYDTDTGSDSDGEPEPGVTGLKEPSVRELYEQYSSLRMPAFSRSGRMLKPKIIGDW